MIYSRLLSHLPRQQRRIYLSMCLRQHFHTTSKVTIVKPFLLTDIGEGITECEIVRWFVEPEARVEEWDKLCEVTSDKASVEITSRFAGIIKKLYYEPGDMAKVGNPLLDIDVPSDNEAPDSKTLDGKFSSCDTNESPQNLLNPDPTIASRSSSKGKYATLATPAVRSITRELNIEIEDIPGSGKGGRVLREDVYRFARKQDSPHSDSGSGKTGQGLLTEYDTQKESIIPLTSHQFMMFKNMTKSLLIPHFLYADEIDFTSLSKLRCRLNSNLLRNPMDGVQKLSYLPFIIKAVSIALKRYPILNAKLEINETTGKPSIILRSQHNIGVAMDTPSGLVVPIVKNVSSLTVARIASEIIRLQELALTGNLTSQDLSGGTITVSNIGSIGGTYVSPVIVEKEVAILGVGKVRTVPAFSPAGELIKKEVCNFSWSADHRVIDGATLARSAEIIRGLLEDSATMILHLN